MWHGSFIKCLASATLLLDILVLGNYSLVGVKRIVNVTYLGPSIHCSSLAPLTGCFPVSCDFFTEGIRLGEHLGVPPVCAGEVLALCVGVLRVRCTLSGSLSNLGEDLEGRCSAEEPLRALLIEHRLSPEFKLGIYTGGCSPSVASSARPT